MSTEDKIKNKIEDLGGKAKEAVGKATKDRDTRNEGRADQAKSNLKDAGENVKDAFKKYPVYSAREFAGYADRLPGRFYPRVSSPEVRDREANLSATSSAEVADWSPCRCPGGPDPPQSRCSRIPW